MLKYIKQKMQEYDSAFIVKRPFLWILKIHWVVLFGMVSAGVNILGGLQLPLWANPLWLIILMLIITLLFSGYWIYKVEAYVNSLYTARSKTIIHFSKVMILLVLFTLPFLSYCLLHMRAVQKYGNSQVFIDGVSLTVNYDFVVANYNDLVTLNDIIDTFQSIEEKNKQSPFGSSGNKPFFNINGSISELPKITGELVPYFIDKSRQRFVERSGSLSEFERDSINQYYYHDTTSQYYYRKLSAFSKPGVVAWMNEKLPQRLFDLDIKVKKQVVTRYRKLTADNFSTYYDPGYVIPDYDYDRLFFDYVSGNVFLSQHASVNDFYSYAETVYNNILNGRTLESEADIELLNDRKTGVSSNLKSDYALPLYICVIVILLFLIHLVFIYQKGGFKIIFQTLLMIVALIVIVFVLAISVFDKNIGGRDYMNEFLCVFFVMLILIPLSLLVISLLAGNKRKLLTFQRKVLPFTIVLIAVWPMVFVFLYMVVSEFFGILPFPVSTATFWAIAIPIQVAAFYLVVRKFNRFNMIPQGS